MKEIINRLSEKEKNFLNKIAKIENKSQSNLLKTATSESLEDRYDAHLGDVAYEEYLKNCKNRPLSELLQEYEVH